MQVCKISHIEQTVPPPKYSISTGSVSENYQVFLTDAAFNKHSDQSEQTRWVQILGEKVFNLTFLHPITRPLNCFDEIGADALLIFQVTHQLQSAH